MIFGAAVSAVNQISDMKISPLNVSLKMQHPFQIEPLAGRAINKQLIYFLFFIILIAFVSF